MLVLLLKTLLNANLKKKVSLVMTLGVKNLLNALGKLKKIIITLFVISKENLVTLQTGKENVLQWTKGFLRLFVMFLLLFMNAG